MRTLITSSTLVLLFLIAKSPAEGPQEAENPAGPQGPSTEAVEPGLVRWHANREAAIAAAKQSRRPLLIFQMLGRLDERFC